MRLSRGMVWACEVVMIVLCAAAAVGQTTHHAQLSVLLGHSKPVNSVAFSPDGRYVLTASHDTTARLWDAYSGKEVRQFIGQSDWVNSIAFSPDGRYVLTSSCSSGRAGSDDTSARLWDVASGKEVRRFAGNFVVCSVAFSRDGRYLITGNNDGVARLWDVGSGEELKRKA